MSHHYFPFRTTTYSVGSWLPEEKKANMWHGREIVVAHGRLPSPALHVPESYNFRSQFDLLNIIC